MKAGKKKPYKVYVALGSQPGRVRASYTTEDAARRACNFWNTQRGADNDKPFHAWIVVEHSPYAVEFIL